MNALLSEKMSEKTILVWTETWNFFELYVTRDSEGYHAIVKTPWDDEATKCIVSRKTLADAKRRCFGMVRGSCEILIGKAIERMCE
jgi:hypothetical protein